MSTHATSSLAEKPASALPANLFGIRNLPMARTAGMLAALALALAIGVVTVLWMQRPHYGPLYRGLGDKEVGGVLESLEKLDVDYRIDSATGAVLVPTDRIHEIRLKLAAQGLPQSSNLGYELLDRATGYGSSQALETARFQRALEGEIARSLMTLHNVRGARVHLALPKQSVFVRDPKKPSASVLVDLYPGRVLDKSQVEAIVHLVASSVPQMEAAQVTVVDQMGRLLNAKDSTDTLSLTAKQFEYKTLVENHLTERVQNILSPLVGSERMRAQITADIDFSLTERTQERFAPETPSVRSEQVSEEQHRGPTPAAGIPGALSNQPPSGGVAPEKPGGQTAMTGVSPEPVSNSKNVTRNFELDRTISHTRPGGSELRRLTVAVVVDNQRSLRDGKEAAIPYSEADLDRFTALVKQAVGYDAARGDQVTVTNAAFLPPEPVEPLPERPFWEQDWFANLAKLLASAAIILGLILGVFRPALRALLTREQRRTPADVPPPGATAATSDDRIALGSNAPGPNDGQLPEDKLTLSSDDLLMLDAPKSYEKRLTFAKKMVDDDSQRVAQVIKAWIGSDG